MAALRFVHVIFFFVFVHGNDKQNILQQKWTKLKEWVESEGGYLHPSLVLDYMTGESFERAFFATDYIAENEILAQLPITTIFSQYIVSKYIEDAQQHPLMSTPDQFMPKGFPDWPEFLEEMVTDEYDYPTLEPWLALGLAWLRENTNELAPWLDLMPDPNYLPILWPHEKRVQLLRGTEAFNIVLFNEHVFNRTLPYIELLGLTHKQVMI